MSVIAIPKILRERLTDEGADAFVQIIDHVEARVQQAVLELAEERFEKRLAQLEVKMEGVRADLITRIESVRVDLITRIESVRAELIKWMFIFWVGQVGMITAILFAFFKR